MKVHFYSGGQKPGGGQTPKATSPLLISGQELLKGNLKVYWQREGATCRIPWTVLTVILRSIMQWSHQQRLDYFTVNRLDYFKYS